VYVASPTLACLGRLPLFPWLLRCPHKTKWERIERVTLSCTNRRGYGRRREDFFHLLKQIVMAIAHMASICLLFDMSWTCLPSLTEDLFPRSPCVYHFASTGQDCCGVKQALRLVLERGRLAVCGRLGVWSRGSPPEFFSPRVSLTPGHSDHIPCRYRPATAEQRAALTNAQHPMPSRPQGRRLSIRQYLSGTNLALLHVCSSDDINPSRHCGTEYGVCKYPNGRNGLTCYGHSSRGALSDASQPLDRHTLLTVNCMRL
jgi:hypothetical protein